MTDKEAAFRMRFWRSVLNSSYYLSRLTKKLAKKGQPTLINTLEKWLQSLANLREGLISCTNLWQACLCPQPLPLCRRHQRIPSLLNPQLSKLNPAGWRLNSIEAFISTAKSTETKTQMTTKQR